MERFFSLEDSTSKYEKWSEYRESFTEYIVRAIKSFYTREFLVAKKMRRLDASVDIKQLIEAYYGENYRPTVAIWGAGGMNDIDAQYLSKNFRLVLIDDNKNAMKQACDRFCLPEDTICVDIPFWKIDASCYDMIEAMIIDGEPVDVVSKYISEITEKIQDEVDVAKFDFSVVGGLMSQLNSRLWALVCKNSNYTKVHNTIAKANDKAVRRLFNIVTSHTKNISIWAYEEDTAIKSEDFSDDLEINFSRWVSGSYDKLDEFASADIPEGGVRLSKVEGNYQFCRLVNELVATDDIQIYHGENFVWPFEEKKNYLMSCFVIQVPRIA